LIVAVLLAGFGSEFPRAVVETEIAAVPLECAPTRKLTV
jgi:hypothetical protein